MSLLGGSSTGPPVALGAKNIATEGVHNASFFLIFFVIVLVD
jgi:hypothetical protein